MSIGALVFCGGAVTVGVLTAAGAVGILLCSLLSGRLGGVRWHERAIRTSIVVYGGFIAGFGAVLLAMSPGGFGAVSTRANITVIVIACVMLAGAGADGNVSSIFRQTMLQVAVPDNLRGRLQECSR